MRVRIEGDYYSLPKIDITLNKYELGILVTNGRLSEYHNYWMANDYGQEKVEEVSVSDLTDDNKRRQEIMIRVEDNK